MISHKCYSTPACANDASKASKDLSRGFQVMSEIIFLISVRKILPTSSQTIDVTSIFFCLELNGPIANAAAYCSRDKKQES